MSLSPAHERERMSLLVNIIAIKRFYTEEKAATVAMMGKALKYNTWPEN